MNNKRYTKHIYVAFIYLTISIFINLSFFVKFTHAYSPPTIPSAHPRIFITPAILLDIKSKVAPGGQMYSVYQNMKSYMERYVDDPINVEAWKKLGIQSYAFIYLIEKDERYSQAVKLLIDEKINIAYPGYSPGKLFNALGRSHQQPIAIGFDWIYDALSQTERERYTDHMLSVSENTMGYMPIENQKAIGNNPTIQGLNNLFAAIAIYGDGYRDDEALTLLHDFGEWLEESTFPQMNKMWQTNGGEVSGRSYSVHNFIRTLPLFDELWRVFTNGSRDLNANFLKNFSYWEVMSWRPDNTHMRNNDYAFFNAKGNPFFRYFYSLLAARYHDPLAQYLANNTSLSFYSTPSEWQYILWHDPSVPSQPYELYPLDAHFDGTGTIISRSSWDIGSYPQPADAVYATFVSGPWWSYHQDKDQNSFTIYNKGSLVVDGKSSTNENTRRHATIVIDDENQISDRDVITPAKHTWQGFGKGTSSEIAKILRYESNTDFLYAQGDASKAYNPDKLSLFTREFVILKPKYFVIFDRVNTTSADYSKKYLLQSINVPKVGDITPPDGTTTYNSDLVQIDRGGTVANGYPDMNGRLFSKTLLPTNSKITVVGSGQTTDLTNKKEPARWRMEIEPSTPQLNDLFLHVMQVGDSNTLQSMSPTIRINADTMVGAFINDVTTPQVVLFSSDSLGADVTSVTYQANYDSSINGKHLLLDMSPGTYDVYKNSNMILSGVTASSQGVLSFSSTGGSTFQVVQTGIAPPPPPPPSDITPPLSPTGLRVGS